MNECLDLCFTQGETASYVFTIRGMDGEPMDLSGYEARSDVKFSNEYSKPYLEIPVVVVDPRLGQIMWKIDAEKTMEMKNCQYVYDIFVIKNKVSHLALSGTIYCNLGVTR